MSLELTGPSSHIYISQRLRLHYVDWGNPGAPPLILIHGNQDHCRNWDWIAQELRHDWHIIAPDLRGHGDSAWSPDGQYSFEAYVCDIAQLINQKKLISQKICSIRELRGTSLRLLRGKGGTPPRPPYILEHCQ